MPTYEYECEQCGEQFEAFQKISDAPLDRCPKCGGAARRLLGTGAAIIVKGSGSGGANCPKGASCAYRDTPFCGPDAPCDASPCDL